MDWPSGNLEHRGSWREERGNDINSFIRARPPKPTMNVADHLGVRGKIRVRGERVQG